MPPARSRRRLPPSQPPATPGAPRDPSADLHGEAEPSPLMQLLRTEQTEPRKIPSLLNI
jgi:hypothetical protein